MQAGGNSIVFVSDWSSLMTPQKATLNIMRTVHFRDLYPVNVSHLNFNFLCLLLLKLSISVDEILFTESTKQIRHNLYFSLILSVHYSICAYRTKIYYLLYVSSC